MKKSLVVVFLGFLTALCTTAGTYFKFKADQLETKADSLKMENTKEKHKREDFEVFFSNEQDKFYCMLDSMKLKKCNP